MVDPIKIDTGIFEKRIFNLNSRIGLDKTTDDFVTKFVVSFCERHNIKVLSLDIFDTLLLRNNKSELTRYYELARLCSKLLDKTINPEDVLLSRYYGLEYSYRTRPRIQGCTEGDIKQVISSQISTLNIQKKYAPKFLDLEIEYEAENLTLNKGLFKACEILAERGVEIILLSDMYLNTSILMKLMQAKIGSKPKWLNKIFSSSDIVLSKHSGKVFAYIETKLKKSSEQILHIGDNIKSDVKNAKDAGWHAFHYPISEAENISRRDDLESILNKLLSQNIDVRKWAQL